MCVFRWVTQVVNEFLNGVADTDMPKFLSGSVKL